MSVHSFPQSYDDGYYSPAGQALENRLLGSDGVDELPSPRYLIDKFLMPDTLAGLYGKWGTAKSFLAMDWALSVATHQQSWLGYKVGRPHGDLDNSVLYVAAEGKAGLGVRKRAWQAERGVDNDWLREVGMHWLAEPVNFLDDQQVDVFVEVATDLSQSLIVIDTLSKCLPGADENGPSDMSKVLAVLERLRANSGACVLLVHHAGANGLWRGHTSLPSGMDTLIKLSRRSGDRIEVEVEKQKDDETYATAVQLAPFEESCVIRPIEGGDYSQTSAGSNDPLTEQELRLLGSIREHSGSKGVSYTQLLELTKLGNGTLDRALKRLVADGFAAKTSSKKRAPYVLTERGQVA
jgi:hypothetical protein